MNKKEMIRNLREDSEYQDFFRAAMEKFGVKTPAEMDDEEKTKFFNYIDKEWSAKKETDVDECKDKKRTKEDIFRKLIRKEIQTIMSERITGVEPGKILFRFKNKILGNIMEMKLADRKSAEQYAKHLGPKWVIM